MTDGTFGGFAGDAEGGALLPEDLAGFLALASSNLVDWVVRSNHLLITNGRVLLRDSQATNSLRRFYRIVEP